MNKIKNVKILLNTIEPAMSIAATLINSKFPMVGHLDILYVQMNLYGQPPVLKGYFSSATRVTDKGDRSIQVLQKYCKPVLSC